MATLDLAGKVALVTGSSRGIGRGIVDRLAEHGAAIVLNGLGDIDNLGALAGTVSERYGVKCQAIATDVGDHSAVSGMVQAIFKNFGRLDILVNNAGILREGVIGMIRDDDVRATLRTNLVGTLNCIQAGARLLQRSGGGSIINMTSIIGVRGNKGQLLYSASKGAVISATLSAAKELAPKGIRVNAIAPGYINTDMNKSVPVDMHRALIAGIGMGRMGEVSDIADVVLFLASSMSRYVTGQIIGVDGGMTI